MTNENKCVLSGRCKIAGSPQCTDQCGSFIAMMGRSGKGGRVGAAGLPADYRLVTLANSPARTEQARIYAKINDYVATFDRQFEEGAERIKSLYLYSESPGTGKTTTAAAILNEWLTAHYVGSLQRRVQPMQRPAYFLDVNAFQTDYNLATMTNDDAGMAQVKSIIQRTQTAPFAILDDIGVRSATEAFRSYVHAIINYRTTNGMPTVFTSNLELAEMERVFDGRLYDRMRDQCAVLSFGGESKRGRR
ncbi:ATP-binding protein [Peribacillus butanolivorans]|uniref:DNA replication protein n=1 Tax=Peribacillus butanolivorans TaxID=421767 RepID=A0ABM6XMQ4_9BACI|nr:ATP-binding protein [Peribacillus butanolivorans]AXN39807.1 DNA replication protein [Peribacillus butanolivorans]